MNNLPEINVSDLLSDLNGGNPSVKQSTEVTKASEPVQGTVGLSELDKLILAIADKPEFRFISRGLISYVVKLTVQELKNGKQ